MVDPPPEVCCVHCEGLGVRAMGDCEAKVVLLADMRFKNYYEDQLQRVQGYQDTEQWAEALHTARFHIYKEFMGLMFAGQPLGAGNRCKLPDCVVWQTRKWFRDPQCSDDCGLLRDCETQGHYTGFRIRKRKSRFDLEEDWNPLW